MRLGRETSKLDISRSLFTIFEVNLEDLLWGGEPHSFVKLKLQSSQATLISRCRFEKYSSELDISRSFVTIFEVNLEDLLHSL